MRKRATDRRKFGAANRFPLRDHSGAIIPFNRSYRPDRRLHSYRVYAVDAEELQLYNLDPLYGSP